jgi:hypothetical protein
VDPVPDPVLLVAPGIEPGTSEFVARNPDHYAIEAALPCIKHEKFAFRKI